ncbi:Dynein beta chain, ciliary, partial [Aduncisulcus paluster]
MERTKIMTICTIEVHAKDVVGGLVKNRVESANEFQWQSQLRLRWDDTDRDCFINICDAQFQYQYEYLGNRDRLVITPLTDRCYVTLTQSLHLCMGGAPAGPAGTGKTETTKDLGRALGLIVYVSNCSPEMSSTSMGQLFAGLASSGAWGCFDEFNRINVEVLSVVATQVKTIIDAVRERKDRFMFEGFDITLRRTVGIFITMNPGYAGRTELPENIKALFRSVSMIVPDYAMIAEIMLLAQGFLGARLLSKKFTTLYSLNRELLSKCDQYDWGLRAMNAVLVVAGSLKRAEPEMPEENVLCRALRDFNIPKIITEDVDIFMGLINDLFPGVDVPRKTYPDLEKTIVQALKNQGLQAEPSFVLKVVQLQELVDVRHSVMLIGDAGVGKSKCWGTLANSYRIQGKKIQTPVINPKAVTTREMYGYVQSATREWRDGLFSCIMRDLANQPNTEPKWIVLDGDIDSLWIESLNTVMDANKVLTLASNERVPLHPHMRLLFEISHLKHATPATVSRAGILYISEQDVGWRAFTHSWMEKRENQHETAHLTLMFETFLAPCLEALKRQFDPVLPVTDIAIAETVVRILEQLIIPSRVPDNAEKELYELYFVFAVIWAVGGVMFKGQRVDWTEKFNKWWRTEFRQVALPSEGSVFDYCLDMRDISEFYVPTEDEEEEPLEEGVEQKPEIPAEAIVVNEEKVHLWVPWSDKVDKFKYDPELPAQATFVPTATTTRLSYIIDLMLNAGFPVLLAGPAGSGKTGILKNRLAQLPEEKFKNVVINLNYFTTTMQLQTIMEGPLEKKAGRTFGPPGQMKLIYFVDDLNMAKVDLYGTQAPITLLRQHIDYESWYDRSKLALKEVKNVQYAAALNPLAGSFHINQRLQRHFSLFAVDLPSESNLKQIYGSLLSGHFSQDSFAPNIAKMSETVADALLSLHSKVSTTFLPTAIKFHYQFNLRDLSNIVGGILNASGTTVPDTHALCKLWKHECSRVYMDRLVNVDDMQTYEHLIAEVVKKTFEGKELESMNESPIIWTNFSNGIGDSDYSMIKDGFPGLSQVLEDALKQYNEENAVMDLVLFEDAMEHVARINRIIQTGSALLVGVGGSGKQSLARLAAYIAGYEVFQISLTSNYGVNEFKVDLQSLYRKCGQKGESIMFLFTDQHIVDEKFLVYINDMLASGNIADLFNDDEEDEIIESIRNEVKQAGIFDTRDNCWNYFINKVKTNLHVVLGFSPVGDDFRIRARRFPALVNNTSIDWFHPWPHSALISVANRFLADVDLGGDEIRESISLFMADAHRMVNEKAGVFAQVERRKAYTTPKSFLELISLYKSLLSSERKSKLEKIERLDQGLVKLQTTEKDVALLKTDLQRTQVTVAEKEKDVENLLIKVKKEQVEVDAVKKNADIEKAKCEIEEKEVSTLQAMAEQELSKAEPILKSAEAALHTLNKGNLTELKSFKKPAAEIEEVMNAVMILLSPSGRIPKDRDLNWASAKKMMGNVDAFLRKLIEYDKEHIPEDVYSAVLPYVSKPDFIGEKMEKKSVAAAGICDWARNIVKFFDVYRVVKPLRDKLEDANVKLQAAQEKLAKVNAKVAALEKRVKDLDDQRRTETANRDRIVTEAAALSSKLNLAQRLVNGLSSEKVRWGESITELQASESTLVGDILLTSAFISYIGPFSSRFRVELLKEWGEKIDEYKIPMSPDSDPLKLLTDDATVAEWNNQLLPKDRVSIENAAITVTCERWPLMIDPQLQGIQWIKEKESENGLEVVRLTQNKYLDIIERCLSEGKPVLIENIGESIDAVLDPLIQRNVIKKGRTKFIKLGDKEIEYDPKFRLFLQTKMANPHYTPEIQAQTTLVNFTVTEDGLEDQILALVVSEERPDLEQQKGELMRQQNEFMIKLKKLEDELLHTLSNAKQETMLDDTALIENLETTKATSIEIAEKVKEAQITEKSINAAREIYRPVATRSSMLYFLMNSLCFIHSMYQFSLRAFLTVFYKAMRSACKSDDVKARVEILIEDITFATYSFVSLGLFETHKIMFVAQMTIQIMSREGKLPADE